MGVVGGASSDAPADARTVCLDHVSVAPEQHQGRRLRGEDPKRGARVDHGLRIDLGGLAGLAATATVAAVVCDVALSEAPGTVCRMYAESPRRA